MFCGKVAHRDSVFKILSFPWLIHSFSALLGLWCLLPGKVMQGVERRTWSPESRNARSETEWDCWTPRTCRTTRTTRCWWSCRAPRSTWRRGNWWQVFTNKPHAFFSWWKARTACPILFQSTLALNVLQSYRPCVTVFSLCKSNLVSADGFFGLSPFVYLIIFSNKKLKLWHFCRWFTVYGHPLPRR